jgi:hypothetical protein
MSANAGIVAFFNPGCIVKSSISWPQSPRSKNLQMFVKRCVVACCKYRSFFLVYHVCSITLNDNILNCINSKKRYQWMSNYNGLCFL